MKSVCYAGEVDDVNGCDGRPACRSSSSRANWSVVTRVRRRDAARCVLGAFWPDFCELTGAQTTR